LLASDAESDYAASLASVSSHDATTTRRNNMKGFVQFLGDCRARRFVSTLPGLCLELLCVVAVMAGCAGSPPTQTSASLGPPPLTPYDVAPSLLNPPTIARTMERLYRPEWRAAAIQGCTLIWVHIGSEGAILEMRLKTSSRVRELDAAAFRVVQEMRFRPAILGDRATAVWIDIPVVFSVGGVPPCQAERPIS
jgi:TonB family protein